MMSEETKIQCPACTAELTPDTVECPWCGHMMTPKVEEKPSEEAPDRIKDWFEPEPTPMPEEPAEPPVPEEPTQPTMPSEPPQPAVPAVAVFPVAEPGLTEIAPVPGRAPASNLKVMGIILTIFSFLALLFFAFQVVQGKLSTFLVLVVPIFGMMIGLISIIVGQKR
ncbi:MAG TPA: hypothetical protein PKY64_01135 [Anaerolineaceae bacterium]|nr:hypothetical protein [Anaerolineaceae bacterium]